MRRIPPLSAVRVFEAAARHENFTAAAFELGMTQAAVSYQIKILEERVGVPLFRREKKRVLLTDAGRRASAEVSRSFDILDSAFGAIRAENDALLSVSTTGTFANTWFAWRLGGFQMAHPELAVRLHTSEALVNFASDEMDCAVRLGAGNWPGLIAELLLPIEFTPMCSPDFLARHGGQLTLDDLHRLPLITPDDPWWGHWLSSAGSMPLQNTARGGIRLDSQSLEGNAAIAGQGVALLTPFFWRNDIADGRLTRPFAHVSAAFDRSYAYWLVYPEHRRNVPKIRQFRDWLVGEITRDVADTMART